MVWFSLWPQSARTARSERGMLGHSPADAASKPRSQPGRLAARAACAARAVGSGDTGGDGAHGDRGPSQSWFRGEINRSAANVLTGTFGLISPSEARPIARAGK